MSSAQRAVSSKSPRHTGIIGQRFLAVLSPEELRDSAGRFGVSDHALTLKPALDAVKADADAANQGVSER